MNRNSSKKPDAPKRPRRSPGKLPPPPPGVPVLTRDEAAAFLGVGNRTFSTWEREGRVTIPRYRVVEGTGRAIFYAVPDLERLREEFRRLEEPYPDPQRPGVYRVPICSYKYRAEALIDAADLHRVEGKRWNVRGGDEDRQHEVILASTTQRVVPLKRVIMGVDAPECKEQIVDFVNGDPLDCRRENLVLKTRSEVNLHRAKSAGRAGSVAASAYRGVGWDAQRRLWKVQIGTRETHRIVGRFRDEAQAAAAYDAAAREMFGDAAPLNFPDGNVPAPTFLGPDGEPVREKNNYRVPRGLPTPPPGVPMLTREEAAQALDVSAGTLAQWERAGHVAFQRYREKDTTGATIFYPAADVALLRERLDKVGQPYPDPHPTRAGVWRVPLRTLDGYIEALIDEADLGIVRGTKWNLTVREGGRTSKAVIVSVGPRDLDRVVLTRLIMGLTGDDRSKRVVHANGNPLDCRRVNLVIGTPSQTTRQCYKILHRCGRPTSSRFKGVSWNERDGTWKAQIRVDDCPRQLGTFDDEEDAALAYDDAARELWGEEARVNFPRAGELPSAAAPVNPAELWPESEHSAARRPGKPFDFAASLNDDGSVTVSWRCVNAAASAGVSFTILRKLPNQKEFARIGAAPGTTHQSRRATFTDATAPASDLAHDSAGAQYIVQPMRGATPCEPSDALVLRFERGGLRFDRPTQARAA